MTSDLEKRIHHHNNPVFDSKFTSKGVPWTLFLTIACHSKTRALKLERLIKSKKSSVFIRSLKGNAELINELLVKHQTVNQSRLRQDGSIQIVIAVEKTFRYLRRKILN